jgi:cobalamin biosynthesis Co2+ chelatase CbiK
LTNQFNSNSSPFAKKYRPKEIDFIISEDYNHEIDQTIDKINKQLEKLHWYDRELFKAYIDSGSYRKLSKQTNIPFNSISRTVNHVKDFIRDNIN